MMCTAAEIFRLAMVLDAIAMYGLLAADMTSMGCNEKTDPMLLALTLVSIGFLLVGAFCLDYGVIG